MKFVSFVVLFSSDFQRYGFCMMLAESVCLLDHTSQIAATACTGHFPRQYILQNGIFVNVILHRTLNHSGKHSSLGIEGSLVSRRKSRQIHVQNGVPAIIGSLRQRLDFRFCNVFAFHHRATWTAWFHGNHNEMVLKPFQDGFVLAGFNLQRPIEFVVVMPDQTGHANPD